MIGFRECELESKGPSRERARGRHGGRGVRARPPTWLSEKFRSITGLFLKGLSETVPTFRASGGKLPVFERYLPLFLFFLRAVW
jgi:hypothetical protein